MRCNTGSPSATFTASTTADDLTPGLHVKTWTIDSGAEPNTAYFLLIVADPSDLMLENDPAGT